MSIFESFMQGQQLAQQQALQRMKMAQMEQLFPMQQQLQQMEMERAQFEMEAQQQKMDIVQRETEKEKQVFAGRLAEQALNITDPEIRSTFLEGAISKMGLSGQIDPADITDDSLHQIVSIGKAVQPASPTKLGRFQASVVGNKVHVIDSVTGESKVTNLGTEVFRPPNMSDDDYEVFKNLSPKDQTKLLEKQLDPAKKAAEKERQDKINTAQDLQKTALDLASGILSKADLLPEVLGTIQGRVDFRLNEDEASLINDIDELSNILLSDKLKLMSGTLSESDIQILKDVASGGLNRVSSVDRFTNRLGKIKSAFEGKTTGSKEQDEKKARLEQLRKEVNL